MNLKLLSPEKDLITVIADELLRWQPDFRQLLVVFPERRPGHYLRKALAERLGRSYLPPRCLSLDDFIDDVYAEKLCRQDRKITPLEAVGFLYEIHRRHPQPLGGAAFLQFDQFFPLGLKIYRDLEELKQAQVKPEELGQADTLVQFNLPAETGRRLQGLSFFYENFYGEIERAGFSTPAFRLNFILNNFSPDIFKEERIILAGFFSLTRSEAELLIKMLSLPQTQLYLIEAKGLAYLEKLLGLSFDAETIHPRQDIPSEKEGLNAEEKPRRAELKFCLAPDSHGQIFALNQEIEAQLKNPEGLNERQVIVLPAAETLFPLYHQTLSSLPSEKFNISLGYPLTRTPLYSFFEGLFNLIQTKDEANRFYTPEYLRFVLHPYTKNIYFPGPQRRADFTRILFHLVEETLTNLRGKLFWSLEEIEGHPQIANSLKRYAFSHPDAAEPDLFLLHLRQIHRKTILPFLEIDNLGDLAKKLIALTEYIGNESTASLHAFFEPYAEAFLHQFEALEKSLINRFRFEHLFSYFQFFRQMMAETTVPFPGTPLRGLQVLGFWETRCLPLDEVYMLDMNEEVIPATAKVDSILPYAVRKAFGLPTYEELERRVEYYFDILTRRAKKVTFFFVENSEKEKSRLVERLIWEKQKRENQPDPMAFIHSVRYQVALRSSEPKPIPKTESMIAGLRQFQFSVSALDAYLSCPLKFYYRFILRLEEKEELAEPMEKKDIGSLVHNILQGYFKKWLGQNLNPYHLQEGPLRQLVEKNFTNYFGSSLSGAAYLIKQQVEAHLVDFLHNYQIPLLKEYEEGRKSVFLQSLELRLEEQWAVDGSVFSVVAIIDRVEKRDKEIYIIDYKTSAREKNFEIKWDRLDPKVRTTWSQAISSLQLPFYTHIWANHFGLKPEEIKAILLLLGKNNLNKKIEYWPFSEDPAERSRQLAMSFEVIKNLLLEIINPALPFSHELAREESCPYCPYTSLCGQ